MLEYGQFCPVAKAAEILGERWTLLVMREVLFGSRRYCDLQRGLGRISPSVLSQRLKTLVDAGVLERRRVKGSYEYHPTPCGTELLPIVEQVGCWGQRWVRSKMTKDELDIELLVLDMQRRIDVTRLPEDTIVLLDFTDQRATSRRWWLVLDEGRLDLCLQHPGREATLRLAARLDAMAKIWMGDVPLERAIAEGALELEAPAALKKDVRRWLRLSLLAQVEPAERTPPRQEPRSRRASSASE